MSDGAAALRVADVRFAYPARRRQPAVTALDGVTLHVGVGEQVALLGPNGSGKSTLFNVVCGRLRPSSGNVELLGRAADRTARADMGVVFQSAALDPQMTVRENLHLQATLYGLPRVEAASRIESGLNEVGLADRADTLVKRLSPGLARRADLVRAVLHRPRLLVLDEPTVGLDPVARRGYLETLAQRRHADTLGTLMSTHLVDEAADADRVVLLHEGRVIADDAPGALTADLGPVIVTVLDPTWTPPTDPDVWSRYDRGWRRTRLDASGAQTIAASLAGAGVAYAVGPPTLADVFEDVTGAVIEGAAS